MKARLLKSILNDTGYIISNHPDYIAVGSTLCHDLIKVTKKTLKISYALDTFREGRKSLENKPKLIFIWDTLNELISNGQISEIINGRDTIENPLPVYTVREGKLVKSITDSYGWPNTDDDGVLMYNNTHFSTSEEALAYGISELNHKKNHIEDSIRELSIKLNERKASLGQCNDSIQRLEEQLNSKA